MAGKNDKNAFVAIGASLGGIFLMIVFLFLIFARESAGYLATIVWAFVVLGIVLGYLAYSQSIPVDFRVKSTGMGHANTTLVSQLPIPKKLTSDIAVRALALNCLTTHYAPLWSEVFTPDFTTQRWSQPDNPRLPQDFFAKLPPDSEVPALGIAAQRSTVVFWDKNTGAPLAPALSWQDGRALELLSRIPLSNTKIHDLTGLYKTPYYSASKIAWALENYPEVKTAAAEKRLLIAPVATYVLWRLSGGKSFVIDPSQAQRTLLFNLRRLR